MSDYGERKRKTAHRADGRCPLCGSAADARYRPFCSRRCADLDLGHWLEGDYRVPSEEVPPEADHPGEEDP